MNIYDEHGKQIGSIEKPEPILQDGKWWEADKFQAPVNGEYYQWSDLVLLCRKQPLESEYLPCWIVREIPRATPEQLAAIGKKEKFDRPVKVKKGDKFWSTAECKMTATTSLQTIGKYRFVLEDVPGERKLDAVKHYSCEGCSEEGSGCDVSACFDPVTGSHVRWNQLSDTNKHYSCDGCRRVKCNSSDCLGNYNNEKKGCERKNWTAKVAVTDYKKAWTDIVNALIDCGLKIDEDDCIDFIGGLHRRANEDRYSVEQIGCWLATLKQPVDYYINKEQILLMNLEDNFLRLVRAKLSDPLYGIKAVTERSAGK